MRLLVCGGRDFNDAEYAVNQIERLHQKTPITRLICGMAAGGDTLALEWAKQSGIPVDEYWAEWKKFGKAAGPFRNQKMLDEGKPDIVLGLPGGNGTGHMIRISRKAEVPVIECQRKLFSRARDLEWGWLSNFWSQDQLDENFVHYQTNEHYYQCEKTLDIEKRAWINESHDATTAKKRGNHPSVPLRTDWDEYKITAMEKGLSYKFPAGSEFSLTEKLIATGDLYLIEFAPWGDRFWGVDDTYHGQNWLGRLLMRRRQELINLREKGQW